MTKFLTVDQPTETAPRAQRRNVYAPRKLDTATEWSVLLGLFGTLGGCLLVATLVAAMVGCVSTEFETATAKLSRTSVLSDVDVEATMAADGTITVRETQSQDAAGKLIDRIPVVAP